MYFSLNRVRLTRLQHCRFLLVYRYILDYPLGLANYQQHGLKIEKNGEDFTYTYVSVDEKDRTFPTKLYRFPMPESELNSNSLVNQYEEWR